MVDWRSAVKLKAQVASIPGNLQPDEHSPAQESLLGQRNLCHALHRSKAPGNKPAVSLTIKRPFFAPIACHGQLDRGADRPQRRWPRKAPDLPKPIGAPAVLSHRARLNDPTQCIIALCSFSVMIFFTMRSFSALAARLTNCPWFLPPVDASKTISATRSATEQPSALIRLGTPLSQFRIQRVGRRSESGQLS